ncbi:DUF3173 domain-containing protein [Enterococcus faecalis]|uniref:DUF3173 family protein n=1 Tax=Enterococcus TaxID=1350 RepID=UPI001A968D41|nr:DUF3173 family protein [Enterococcus faecalis]MBO1125363.1 DUF3173 domain-containing protein [Enterococcus faecalis]
MRTVTKKDLIDLGYSNYYADKIFKKCKEQLVKDGFLFYKNSKIKRIPVSTIEKVLNISWEDYRNEKSSKRI